MRTSIDVPVLASNWLELEGKLLDDSDEVFKVEVGDLLLEIRAPTSWR